MLNASRKGERESHEKEADGQTSDRAEGDTVVLEKWVKPVLHNWSKGDTSDRIERLEEVVGNAIGLHLSGLRDQVVEGLTPAEPEKWKTEAEI